MRLYRLDRLTCAQPVKITMDANTYDGNLHDVSFHRDSLMLVNRDEANEYQDDSWRQPNNHTNRPLL